MRISALAETWQVREARSIQPSARLWDLGHYLTHSRAVASLKMRSAVHVLLMSMPWILLGGPTRLAWVDMVCVRVRKVSFAPWPLPFGSR